MIIDKIETFALRIPFKRGAKFAAAAWADKGLPAADSLLVKITTDQGLTGWGESFGFRTVMLTKRAIDEVIAPLCIGQETGRIAPLMLDIQRKLAVFGRNGSLFFGLSAVDIALWDIAGKAANAPIVQLLGGGASDLACYASFNSFADPELVRAEVRRATDAGFHSMKLHETDLSVVRAAREEAGSDVALMVDVNCAWTLNEVRGKAEALREFHLKWLEEPVWPPENFDGLAQLRATTGIPLAAGENVSTFMDYERLLAMGAVDFVQPSPAKMGGITELSKVFQIAALRNVVVMPHSFYDGPGLLAAIHATAALGTADSMIECRFFDLEAQPYGGALAPEHGRIAVPQRPGLGFEPDPLVIRDYVRT
jgi:L-alanine-DL-glutamate epimerase-like enolase superfamily enzyme